MTIPENRPLIIEGVTHLADGQNFYDQAPFKHVVDAAAATTLFTPDQYRVGLSVVVNKFHTHGSSERKRDISYRRIQEANLSLLPKTHRLFRDMDIDAAIADGSYKTFRGLKLDFAETLFDAVEQIEPFPLWSQYVHIKRRPGGYDTDGTIGTARHRVQTYVPTYAHWLTEQQARQQRGRMWGIQEVIPTDSVHEQAAKTGQRLEHRRWIIRKMMN